MNTTKEDNTQIDEQATSAQSQEDNTQIDSGATTTRSHSFSDLFKVQASEIKRLQANNKELKQELDGLKIRNDELEGFIEGKEPSNVQNNLQKSTIENKFRLPTMVFLFIITALLLYIVFFKG